METNQNDAVAEALQLLVSDSLASRLWQRDASLWPEPSFGGDPADKTLGWLDLPMRLSMLGKQFAYLNSQLVSDGFTDVVVLGMGGSSMTPLTLSSLFGESNIRLHAIDTVNPVTIANLTGQFNLSKTLFFVSSKSGTTVESLSLEAHFRSAMANDPNTEMDRRRFVALTDPGTPLADRARAGEFGTWISTPEDVGGRFSALSAFGMMPAAATGINIRQLAESATRMATMCGYDSAGNPGLILGAFLAANALAGRNKVTLLTGQSYSTFGMWVDQLLAESTGKNGKGLIPITGEPDLKIHQYRDDRQFVVFNPERESTVDSFSHELSKAGHPVLLLETSSSDKHDIAGEFFRWQFATATASSLMDIYPFDQPDVESAKIKSRELLSNRTSNINDLPVSDALSTVLGNESPNYVAITAFLPETPELTTAFSNLRKAISEKTGMATTFGYGPRYLHSTGQLYKGGPKNAIVLGFISGEYDDLVVPGESYTFGQLTEAQAEGDFMVMAGVGQTVLPVRLSGDLVEEIMTVTENINRTERP